MKKKIIIIVSILLVLLLIGAVVIYFVLQSAGKKISDEIQTQLDKNPEIEAMEGDENTGTSEICNILTLDIAKQMLGEEAKLGSQNYGNCTYSLISADSSSFGVLTMVVSKLNTLTAKTNFEAAKTSIYEGSTENVTGLNADEAYYASNLKQLSILKGDSWIIISGVSDKFESEKELAIETAKLVLE
jgi:hypothetical protein